MPDQSQNPNNGNQGQNKDINSTSSTRALNDRSNPSKSPELDEYDISKVNNRNIHSKDNRFKSNIIDDISKNSQGKSPIDSRSNSDIPLENQPKSPSTTLKTTDLQKPSSEVVISKANTPLQINSVDNLETERENTTPGRLVSEQKTDQANKLINELEKLSYRNVSSQLQGKIDELIDDLEIVINPNVSSENREKLIAKFGDEVKSLSKAIDRSQRNESQKIGEEQASGEQGHKSISTRNLEELIPDIGVKTLAASQQVPKKTDTKQVENKNTKTQSAESQEVSSRRKKIQRIRSKLANLHSKTVSTSGLGSGAGFDSSASTSASWSTSSGRKNSRTRSSETQSSPDKSISGSQKKARSDGTDLQLEKDMASEEVVQQSPQQFNQGVSQTRLSNPLQNKANNFLKNRIGAPIKKAASKLASRIGVAAIKTVGSFLARLVATPQGFLILLIILAILFVIIIIIIITSPSAFIAGPVQSTLDQRNEAVTKGNSYMDPFVIRLGGPSATTTNWNVSNDPLGPSYETNAAGKVTKLQYTHQYKLRSREDYSKALSLNDNSGSQFQVTNILLNGSIQLGPTLKDRTDYDISWKLYLWKSGQAPVEPNVSVFQISQTNDTLQYSWEPLICGSEYRGDMGSEGVAAPPCSSEYYEMFVITITFRQPVSFNSPSETKNIQSDNVKMSGTITYCFSASNEVQNNSVAGNPTNCNQQILVEVNECLINKCTSYKNSAETELAGNVNLSCPVQDPRGLQCTSGYDLERILPDKEKSPHPANDFITNGIWTVLAPISGTATIENKNTEWNNCGVVVKIVDQSGNEVMIAHLDSNSLSPVLKGSYTFRTTGVYVEKGSAIGKPMFKPSGFVGKFSSGGTCWTGAHTHIEVTSDSQKVDPETMIRNACSVTSYQCK